MKTVAGNVTKPIFNTQHCVILHCVNNINVMGSGVAKALYTKWPKVKSEYHYHNSEFGLKLGDVIYTDVEDNTVVAQIVGQDGVIGVDNKKPVRYEALREGFKKISNNYWSMKDHVTIITPQIGCGLAGGSWYIVDKILDEEFEPYENKIVYIYFRKHNV
jgi:O-acetyl-ADP-ribose deacetylase (regulator of RNase III)